MCDPRNKSREDQSEAPQWEKEEVKAKHVRKEGLTGLGKVKKKQNKENLELSDQDSNSKKTEGATVRRTALLSNPNVRARKTGPS